MEMSNGTGWITFDELLNTWSKMPHEIICYISMGLQPYSPRGRQIIDRKTLPKEYNGLLQIEKSLKSVTAKRLFWDHRKELKETSFPTEPYEEFDFTFPIDEEKADSAIAKARTFTFKIDDANEFAKQNGLPLILEHRANVRKAVTLEAAKSIKTNYPNLTQKEAAARINQWLEDNKYEQYSVKHLIKIISRLKFSLGKAGRPV